jgi:hypothetical protein
MIRIAIPVEAVGDCLNASLGTVVSTLFLRRQRVGSSTYCQVGFAGKR